MASGQFYVTKNNEILGPLSPADLRAMVASGNLLPDDQVSADRQKWYLAGAVKGLFTSTAVAVTPPVVPEVRGITAVTETSAVLSTTALPATTAVPIYTAQSVTPAAPPPTASPLTAELVSEATPQEASVMPLRAPPQSDRKSPPLLQAGKNLFVILAAKLSAAFQWLSNAAIYAKHRFESLRAAIVARELRPEDQAPTVRRKWRLVTTVKELFTLPSTSATTTLPVAAVASFTTDPPVTPAAPFKSAVPLLADLTPEATPPASLVTLPAAISRVAGLTTAVLQGGKKFIASLFADVTAIVRWLTNAVSYTRVRCKAYVLRNALHESQFALGKKLYQAGLGDRQLIDQIVELTKQIEAPGANPAALHQLKESRRQLTVRLAETVLSGAACPVGVETEYRAAAAAIEGVYRNDELLRKRADTLREGKSGTRERLIAGACSASVVLCTIVIASFVVQSRFSGGPIATDSHLITEDRAVDNKKGDEPALTRNSAPALPNEVAISPRVLADAVKEGATENVRPGRTASSAAPSGLYRVGYSPTRCLICDEARPTQVRYSDQRGFGLCDKCGGAYQVWGQVLARGQAGAQLTQSDLELTKPFQAILSRHFRREDSDARRGIGLMIMSGKFATSEWDALTAGDDAVEAAPQTTQ